MEQSDGVGTLSRARQSRYSIVVRTTEPEQLVDQDDSDQRIIQRVLAGNRDDFTMLITRYSDPLYRHALCMTGSPDVAEDILQLSFIKAYQHLASFREELPFDVWFTRILINGCLDRIKARTRRERWLVPMAGTRRRRLSSSALPTTSFSVGSRCASIGRQTLPS